MRVSARALAMTLMAIGLAAGGCVPGGGGGGSGGSGGDAGSGGDRPGGGATCEAVGPALELPAAPQLALAAGADAYVALQEEGGFGSGDWATWVAGAGEPTRFDESIGRTPLALATGPNGAVGVSFQISPLEPRLHLRRWDGAAWTRADEDGSADLDLPTIFVDAGDLAVGPSGDTAVVWLMSEGGPDNSATTGYALIHTEGRFLAPEIVFTPADTLSDNELHVAVGPDDAVHVLAHQYVEEVVTMIYRRRGPDGAWGPIIPVGPAPGTLGNITVTGITVTGGGAVYAAEAHGSYGPDTSAGGAVYRIDGESVEQIASIDDIRTVVGGLAMTPLGERVAIVLSRGENNFDPAESEDSVDLYVCDGGGGCDRAAQPTSVRGVFYGDVAIATRGDEVAVLWHQEPKRDVDAPETNVLARYRCP